MNKKNNCIHLVALLLMAHSGFFSNATAAGERPARAGFDVTKIVYAKSTVHGNEQAIHSDCRRNGVVWSGGVARRGPDRISPRPVRSRWQSADVSPIYCTGGKPFTQQRVADQSWIR